MSTIPVSSPSVISKQLSIQAKDLKKFKQYTEYKCKLVDQVSFQFNKSLTGFSLIGFNTFHLMPSQSSYLLSFLFMHFTSYHPTLKRTQSPSPKPVCFSRGVKKKHLCQTALTSFVKQGSINNNNNNNNSNLYSAIRHQRYPHSAVDPA